MAASRPFQRPQRSIWRCGARGAYAPPHMKALLYGVRPEPQPEPDTDNHLLRNLARTPMRLERDYPDPAFLLPDWVVTKPRLVGICGSDSKQVFMDWGNEVGST